MKRSEMVKLMAHKLVNYDDAFTFAQYEAMMHLLLNELEEAGMMPPADRDGYSAWEEEEDA